MRFPAGSSGSSSFWLPAVWCNAKTGFLSLCAGLFVNYISPSHTFSPSQSHSIASLPFPSQIIFACLTAAYFRILTSSTRAKAQHYLCSDFWSYEYGFSSFSSQRIALFHSASQTQLSSSSCFHRIKIYFISSLLGQHSPSQNPSQRWYYCLLSLSAYNVNLLCAALICFASMLSSIFSTPSFLFGLWLLQSLEISFQNYLQVHRNIIIAELIPLELCFSSISYKSTSHYQPYQMKLHYLEYSSLCFGYDGSYLQSNLVILINSLFFRSVFFLPRQEFLVLYLSDVKEFPTESCGLKY